MLATAVFAVILVQAGANPTYSIIQEVKGMETISAFEVCRRAIPQLKIPEEAKKNMACVEIVLHNEKGERYEQPVPPNNGRRMGNTTAYTRKE
jgi:hypothetical protein